MTTYDPQPGVHVGRAPCAACGAAFRLHGPSGSTVAERVRLADRGELACPSAARPATFEAALDDYRAAVATRDQARVFVARGEVQRLGGALAGPAIESIDAAHRVTSGQTTFYQEIVRIVDSAFVMPTDGRSAPEVYRAAEEQDASPRDIR